MTAGKAQIRAILGTMNFDKKKVSSDCIVEMIDYFRGCSCSRDDVMLDTARMYVGGEGEAILGSILNQEENKVKFENSNLTITTKANPWEPNALCKKGLNGQVKTSFEALQTEQVDLFYLHAPDLTVDIKDTLAAVQELYEQGKFKRFGLSNYAAWEVTYVHMYMQQKGWVIPTVYQGMFNAITRSVETELFPTLRRLNMSFNAYNPLAGGLLTGKYHSKAKDQLDNGNRFTNETKWGKIYIDRFMQEQHFEAISLIDSACRDNDIVMVDASMRWLRHHSILDDSKNDAVIVGASSVEQLKQNIQYLEKDEVLPPAVVDAFEQAWELCKSICPSYSRGYSGEQLVR